MRELATNFTNGHEFYFLNSRKFVQFVANT